MIRLTTLCIYIDIKLVITLININLYHKNPNIFSWKILHLVYSERSYRSSFSERVDSLQDCVRFDINCSRSCSVVLVYKIVSGLTFTAQDPAHWFGIDSLQDRVWFDIDSSRSCSVVWVYKIVSGLTFIAQERAQWFGIDSLQDHVRFDIDSSKSCPVVWH